MPGDGAAAKNGAKPERESLKFNLPILFMFRTNEVTKGTGHDTRSTISTTAGASFAVVRNSRRDAAA